MMTGNQEIQRIQTRQVFSQRDRHMITDFRIKALRKAHGRTTRKAEVQHAFAFMH